MQGWPGEFELPYDVIIAEGDASDAVGKPITDVIFDFGNVLLYWDPASAVRGRYDEQTIADFLNNDITSFYDACYVLDGGSTLPEAIEFVRSRAGDKWADMFTDYLNHFALSLTGEVPGMKSLLADLHAAGIGVWGLSNWQQDMFPIAKENFEILHMLDDAVVSGFVKMRKPNPECFNYALNQFNCSANTTLFVDDLALNIAGANAVGMRAVRFATSEPLRALLIEGGIQLPKNE